MIWLLLNSFRHWEQLFDPFSIQLVWNTWPHGVVDMSLTEVNDPRQVEQAVFILEGKDDSTIFISFKKIVCVSLSTSFEPCKMCYELKVWCALIVKGTLGKN